MSKRVIWSSEINLNDWEFDEEYLKEGAFLQEGETLTEEKKYKIANEINVEYLSDERLNLNIQLENPILIIARLGLWNGRRSGYRIIQSGNIKDILHSSDDSIEWYSDGYNIKGIGVHHDGTNYYEYREIRPNVNIQNLYDKLRMNEKISRSYINHYTKSINSHVQKVYGW